VLNTYFIYDQKIFAVLVSLKTYFIHFFLNRNKQRTKKKNPYKYIKTLSIIGIVKKI
jgi:hypothetical protein